MDKVYRFYAYNNMWWPDKYLWHRTNPDSYLMMSAANFIDNLLEALSPDQFNLGEETRSVIKSETIYVDMDRLERTSPMLAQKTIRMVQDFDDISLNPIAIEEWLEELENFVCGKVVSE